MRALLLAVLVACSGNGATDGADVHALGSCNVESYAQHSAFIPSTCERECESYTMGSGASCTGMDGAGSAFACTSTFVGSDGATGCCVLIPASGGSGYVGAFFECE
jgi:hypothetical protein